MESDNIKKIKNLAASFARALDEKDVLLIRSIVGDLNAADAAMLLHKTSGQELKFVLDLLDNNTVSQVMVHLDEDVRVSLLKLYRTEDLIEIVNLLHSDDLADILNELPVPVREEVLKGLNEEVRSLAVDLLRYDEDIAGGLMGKELVKARVDWTVIRCIEEIRKQMKGASKFYAVYVVNDQDKLLGWIPLHTLILTDSNALVQDIYDPDIISVKTYLKKNEVADTMRTYNLEAAPVVNRYGQLVGRITIDDVVDVITEQAEEDRQMMSGIAEDVEEHDSIWKLTRARLPWLVVGIIGGLISVLLIGNFERDIMQVTSIAFFIPLIQATSGNVGIQSSSIVVQSLAKSGMMMKYGILARLFKVIAVAVLNGLLLSLMVLAANLLMGTDTMRLYIIVSLVLFIVVLVASFIGTVTPLLLNFMGFNPALASGPFITTISDILGLGVYLLSIHLIM